MTATSGVAQPPSATLRDMSFALRTSATVVIAPLGVYLRAPLAYGSTGPVS
jgi:hypothetical protein